MDSPKINKHPFIYEINTRVWIKRFFPDQISYNLLDIPDNYWHSLVSKGFHYVWLMGVWETCSSLVPSCCFEDFLKWEYSKALKDWKTEDVIGSPYSINRYNLNPLLGNDSTLIALKNKLNKLGLKLILDFIPNHFGADSDYIKSNPEIFLEVSESKFLADNHTYFLHQSGRTFAHGRDPFFPAWQDTIQINYFSEHARIFMSDLLLELSKVCDGVRCDMAMLALTNVFQNTWGGIISETNLARPEQEFWKFAIEKIKNERGDFLMIAEAYWDLEWQLQQLGFDFTYDKQLTDRLKTNANHVKEHLRAEKVYQDKSLRFIENHDEERAAKLFGKEKSKAAAIIISTIPGMHLFYDGQFEGKQIKLPVQLGREPIEKKCVELTRFYDSLFQITKDEIFNSGNWQILETFSSWFNNETNKNILAWLWTNKNDKYLITVNFSEHLSTCRVKLELNTLDEVVELNDLLNNQIYLRSSEEIQSEGLYIELKPYQNHIFKF